MANNRKPTGIQVNGVALLVKDPDASSTNDRFHGYQRVPGIANFTMPDETGSSNEIQLQDGNVAFAQIAGVGQITGSIGALGGHATHRFLAKKRESGGNVTLAVVRPALKLGDVTGGLTVTANSNVVAVAAAARNKVKALGAEGVLFAFGAGTDDLEGAFFYDSGAAAAADDHKFRPILRIADDGSKIELEANVASALTGTTNKGEFRQGGIIYEDVLAVVNGLGAGDFQSGSGVSANISFQPANAVPVQRVEHKLVTEYGTSDYDDAFGDI